MTTNVTYENLSLYHQTYRTIAYSIYNTNSDIRALYPDNSTIDQRAMIWLCSEYFIWLISDFAQYANSLGRPWFIINGDTKFCPERFNFTKEEKNIISTKGLNVFMHEPLFILNPDNSWPWMPSNGEPNFYELEHIEKFCQEIGCKPKQCTVYLCEHGLGDYLHQKNLFTKLNFKNLNTFAIQHAHCNIRYSWPTTAFDEIHKKGLCLNYRYEGIREMLVAYLVGKGYDKQTYLTFYHHHVDEEMRKRLSFEPEKLGEKWAIIKSGIDNMQPQLPYILDASNPKIVSPITESIPDISMVHNIRNLSTMLSDYYTLTFAFIYCESRPFSPRSEMSEKTINPILAMRPFLPFAAPYFLKSLRELGFKTFNDFWDESFDEIEDNCERFKAYLDVVDFIYQQDFETLKEMGQQMLPIIEHNRIHLLRNFIKQQMPGLWSRDIDFSEAKL